MLARGGHMQPLIIFLNGTSSSGKTSIATALQHAWQTPLLHIGIDTSFDMFPRDAIGEGESRLGKYGYEYLLKNGRLDHIVVGPYAQRLLRCVVPITNVLVQANNDLVIDEILFPGEGRTFLADYAAVFAHARAYFIRVDCALPVLEQREAARGDRHPGLARLQYSQVHAHGYRYDCVVDTSVMSLEACVQAIVHFIRTNPEPTAFAAIRAHHKESDE